jgi:hypothetical protein
VAGAEIIEVVPAGKRWRFISLRASLTTSAVVGNRVAGLSVDDGAGVIPLFSDSNFNHAASSIHIYDAAVYPGQLQLNGGFEHTIPMPAGIELQAGWRLRTITRLLDPGDNWTAPSYCVEEWDA